MYSRTLVPLKLGYIGQPLLIGHTCMELTVQPVFRDVLGISGLSGAAVVLVLNGRFYIQAAANTKYSLFVYIHLVVVYQIILNTAVTLIWVLCMYLFHNFCNLLVFQLSGALFTTQPAVIGCPGNSRYGTGLFYRISIFSPVLFRCCGTKTPP